MVRTWVGGVWRRDWAGVPPSDHGKGDGRDDVSVDGLVCDLDLWRERVGLKRFRQHVGELDHDRWLGQRGRDGVDWRKQ